MDEETILKVWNKGKIDSNNDSKIWRKDEQNAWIKFSEYGNVNSETNYGWEIDHIVAQDNGGSDNLSNLRPLQWKNNRLKSDGRLKQSNKITAEGTKNIRIEN